MLWKKRAAHHVKEFGRKVHLDCHIQAKKPNGRTKIVVVVVIIVVVVIVIIVIVVVVIDVAQQQAQ